MKTKVCTKCGGEKPLSEYYGAKSNRDGITGSCKRCFMDSRKSNRKNWKSTPKGKEALIHQKRRHKRKQRAELADRYIAVLINRSDGILISEIRQHPELIEQKRTIIQFKRTINNLKQKENGNNNASN